MPPTFAAFARLIPPRLEAIGARLATGHHCQRGASAYSHGVAGDTFKAGVLASILDQALLTNWTIAADSPESILAARTLGAKGAAAPASRAGANRWQHEFA